MNAVAPDRHVALDDRQDDAGAVDEMHGHAVATMLDPDAAAAEGDRIGSQSVADRGQEDLVQIRPVDRDLRPIVAGVAPARLAVDQLAVARIEADLAGLDALGGELIGDAEVAQDLRCMRQQVDADAERLDLGHGLEHAAGDADLMQRDRKSTRLNSSHITISYAV